MKEYSLLSLNVVAYLKAKGFVPTKIVNDKDKGSVMHYFEDTPELHFYLKEYKNDKNLQSFISALAETRKQVKTWNK